MKVSLGSTHSTVNVAPLRNKPISSSICLQTLVLERNKTLGEIGNVWYSTAVRKRCRVSRFTWLSEDFLCDSPLRKGHEWEAVGGVDSTPMARTGGGGGAYPHRVPWRAGCDVFSDCIIMTKERTANSVYMVVWPRPTHSHPPMHPSHSLAYLSRLARPTHYNYYGNSRLIQPRLCQTL